MRHLPKAQIQRLARAKAKRRAKRRRTFGDWVQGMQEVLGAVYNSNLPTQDFLKRTCLPWIVTRSRLSGGRVLITVAEGPDREPFTSQILPYEGCPYRPWVPRRQQWMPAVPLKG